MPPLLPQPPIRRFGALRHLHRQLWPRVRQWGKGAAGQGLDLLFPPSCVGCGRSGSHFCDACAQQVRPVDPPLCAHCGRQQDRPVARCVMCAPSPDGSPAPAEMLTLSRAATLFTWPVREAIHDLKYAGRRELARPLARYLVAAYQSAPWLDLAGQIDAVVPVPLHAERLAERGFNQSELLAQPFAEAVGLALEPTWLHRQRSTRPQVGLDAAGRRANVQGAFWAEDRVAGKSLLLVDDVYTTGATLAACAQVAREAGAIKVYALALALPTRQA